VKPLQLALALALLAVARCSPAPVPSAQPDTLAIARGLPAAIEAIEVRLAVGRGRVEFWRGVAFQRNPRAILRAGAEGR
jgi:hypothetical protein